MKEQQFARERETTMRQIAEKQKEGGDEASRRAASLDASRPSKASGAAPVVAPSAAAPLAAPEAAAAVGEKRRKGNRWDVAMCAPSGIGFDFPAARATVRPVRSAGLRPSGRTRVRGSAASGMPLAPQQLQRGHPKLRGGATGGMRRRWRGGAGRRRRPRPAGGDWAQARRQAGTLVRHRRRRSARARAGTRLGRRRQRA